MSFDPEFRDMMPDTVLWQPCDRDGSGKPAVDGHGHRNFSTPAKTVQCRVQEEVRMVRDPSTGKEVVSKTQLYLAPTTTDGSDFYPDTADKFTLSLAGYRQPIPQVIMISRANDQDGLHHWELSA